MSNNKFLQDLNHMLPLLSIGSVAGVKLPPPPMPSWDAGQITVRRGNAEFPSVHEILMQAAVDATCSTRLKGNKRLSILKPNLSDHNPGIRMHGALKDMCHCGHGYTVTEPPDISTTDCILST